MKSSSSSAAAPGAQVRAYIAGLPPDTRRVFKQLRAIIRDSAAGLTDTWSYQIPAFRLDGKILVWYAAWKNHVSLYPVSDAVKRANASALSGYQTSKGTVRFPLDRPLPVSLIKRLVKARRVELKTPRGGK